MSKYLVKIKDLYFEWSTIVDAPVTYGMTLAGLRKYIKEQYGNEGLETLAERLERVEQKGTSSLLETLAELISSNRAGEREERLTADEIYSRYKTTVPCAAPAAGGGD